MRQSTAKKITPQERHARVQPKNDDMISLVKEYGKKSPTSKNPVTNQDYIKQMERGNYDSLCDFA